MVNELRVLTYVVDVEILDLSDLFGSILHYRFRETYNLNDRMRFVARSHLINSSITIRWPNTI